jgi:aspartate carbamoyltransferase catalytic subunit
LSSAIRARAFRINSPKSAARQSSTRATARTNTRRKPARRDDYREHKKKIENLNVAIIGDILHSRVARSNIHLLTKLGATIKVAGPKTLVPNDFQHLVEKDLFVSNSVEEAIEGADVVMILRIQRERQDSAYFPTLREYAIHYGLTQERLDLAKSDAIVLHPGPMNRGIEIASDVPTARVR